MRPQIWQPTRLPRPWDSPGKNTGVGCHFLLQYMKVKSESEVAQSCLTLATPWTVAHQDPPSMGFSRQKYWSGMPLPSLNLYLKPFYLVQAIHSLGTSLVVQWLRLQASNVCGMGFIPGWWTLVPHTPWHSHVTRPSNAHSPSQASTVCEPWISRCSSWI